MPSESAATTAVQFLSSYQDSSANKNSIQTEPSVASIATSVSIQRAVDQQRKPTDQTSRWSDPTVATRARAAGRALAAQTSDEDFLALRKARAELAVRHAQGLLAPNEIRKLAVLDWELDCIEDAREGAELERYLEIARSVRKFGEDLQGLVGSIRSQMRGR